MGAPGSAEEASPSVFARDVLVVVTPENATFEHPLGGLVARAISWGIDGLVMAVLVVTMAFGVTILGVVSGALAYVLLFLGMFLVQWWYRALFERFAGGQTPGKRLLGLRALRVDGLPLTLWDALVRNLLRVVDFLPGLYLGGAVCAALDPLERRLGDLAAGTVVVRDRAMTLPTDVVPAVLRHNSFLDDPQVRLAARRVTPPERDLLITLGVRRDRLPLAVRHDLFGQLATHLEARLGVLRPGYLSEESYCLHLAAAVLSVRREATKGRGPP